jgi:Fe-S cluster assembly protein SufD
MSVAEYIDEVSRTIACQSERQPDWVRAEREQAYDAMRASGFPTVRDEDWKYMAPLPLQKRSFIPASALPQTLSDSAVALLEHWRLPDAWSVVLLDGYFSPALSRLNDLDERIVLTGLTQALNECPERVRSHSEAAPGADASYRHGLFHFNAALFTDGLFLEIPRGVVLDKPVQLLHLTTRAESLATTHNLVALSDGASAQMVETYVSAPGVSGMTSASTRLSLAPSARLEHFKVQAESEQAAHFASLHADQARSSVLIQHNIALGGYWVRNDIATELKQGAECNLNGLFLGRNRQYIDNHTRVVHAEPHTVSQQEYRGVMMDRSRGVFQGRIVVAAHAQQTVAAMNSRNLLLSSDAEIDAKPQLEILADDVRCSHGFSVGDLAPESLFYLVSRGIDAATARSMLTFAFAHERVERIGLLSLRNRVQGLLLDSFPHTDIRRDWL